MKRRKKPGEDPKIRSMRVRAWVRAVKLASGLGLAELEEMFSQRLGVSTPSRSCIWEKYQRGEVVPRSRLQTKRGLSLVERVEQRYPETAMWLSSPLWRLADKIPMEMSEIREIYEELPTPFHSIFIAKRHEASEVFWRRPVDPEHVCQILRRLGERDAMGAITTSLAMVKEAEITQNQYQHELAVDTARICIGMLKRDGVLNAELLEDFCSRLEASWRRAEYYSVVGEEEDDDENDDGR